MRSRSVLGMTRASQRRSRRGTRRRSTRATLATTTTMLDRSWTEGVTELRAMEKEEEEPATETRAEAEAGFEAETEVEPEAAVAVEFPIEDYDDLRVSDTLPLLPELDADE